MVGLVALSAKPVRESLHGAGVRGALEQAILEIVEGADTGDVIGGKSR